MPSKKSASSLEDERTIIHVVGTAEVPRSPSVVVLSAGVESDAPTASDAMHQNAETLVRLRKVLGRAKIRAKDICTTNLALAPIRHRDDARRIIGFKVTHQLTISFRDIEQSGGVIDALVGAGATNVDGPRRSWLRRERAEPEARHAAIVDANEQAEAYARSLALRVRRVLSMRDGGSHVMAAHVARRAVTEINTGEEVARISVNAEYELVKP